jgi:hypothetical protein
MMDRTAPAPGEVGISPADLPTLERLHLLHALLDDESLPARLRLPKCLRQPLLDHARGLLGLSSGPDPHPDAELLALGAEMGLLGEVLRTWPDDATAEHADARLEQVELRIVSLVPRTGAGLAVKLRLACQLCAGGDPIRPGDGESLPDGHDRACLLRTLAAEAEALDATVPRDASRG